METQSLGRFISRDPVESLFFSTNSERVKSFTDLKINELRKIIEQKTTVEEGLLERFLAQVDIELDSKFLFDESTRHLKDNIKAPITFAYYDMVEQKY
mmetsp:Transcript_20774/g.20880  ORF Transcript_20774/g.20880 Transcript_20774/m.20880 type:complete len:98 (+) Transcript_20774:171-464(+)